MESTDILTRLRAVEERRPGVVALTAAMLAGATVIGAILLQGRETETAPRPSLTYLQCSSVQGDMNRLACYDDVTRQAFLPSPQNGRRMGFGELLGEQRSNQARSTSAP